MEVKTKHILIGTGIGGGIGLASSFLVKDKATKTIIFAVGMALGIIVGYVYKQKSSIVGSGAVNSETKKNKIVFTR